MDRKRRRDASQARPHFDDSAITQLAADPLHHLADFSVHIRRQTNGHHHSSMRVVVFLQDYCIWQVRVFF